MTEDSDYYYWKKGEAENLNHYFDTTEFVCPCKNDTCVDQKISKRLIGGLTTTRIEIAEPLYVNSGFRCHKHQEEIRASGQSTVVAKVSTHEKGDAGDVKTKKLSLPELNKVLEKHFDSMGLAKTFTHVDTRTDKKRTWNY